MIVWLSEGLKNIWLRVFVSIFLFGWLVWIAWRERQDYRAVTEMVTRQFDILKDDHTRAEAAMKILAAQVLKNTQATSKSTEVVKKTAKAVEDLPDK